MSDSDLICLWAELFRAVEGITKLLQLVDIVIGTLVRGGGIGRFFIEPKSKESGESMQSSTNSSLVLVCNSLDWRGDSFVNIDDSVVSLFRSWITLDSGSFTGS